MKTNPIGVRFRVDILEKLKTEHNAETPQKALNFLERFFVTHHALVRDLKQPLRSNAVQAAIPESGDATKDVNNEILLKISEYEAELKRPPKNPLIGVRAWKKIREDKINELKNKMI